MTELMAHAELRAALLQGRDIPQIFGPARPIMAQRIHAVTACLLLTRDESLQAALIESDSGPLNRRRRAAQHGREILRCAYRGYHPELPEYAVDDNESP